MKHYYGLRLMSIFYKLLAVVVCLFTIVSAGFVFADAILTTRSIEILPGSGASWAVQALSVLVIGGLIGLTFYVLGQLIDAQLATHRNTKAILDEIQQVRQHFDRVVEQEERVIDQLKKQRRALRSIGAEDDGQDIRIRTPSDIDSKNR